MMMARDRSERSGKAPHNAHRRGVTLMEAMFFISIVGIMGVGGTALYSSLRGQILHQEAVGDLFGMVRGIRDHYGSFDYITAQIHPMHFRPLIDYGIVPENWVAGDALYVDIPSTHARLSQNRVRITVGGHAACGGSVGPDESAPVPADDPIYQVTRANLCIHLHMSHPSWCRAVATHALNLSHGAPEVIVASDQGGWDNIQASGSDMRHYRVQEMDASDLDALCSRRGRWAHGRRGPITWKQITLIF